MRVRTSLNLAMVLALTLPVTVLAQSTTETETADPTALPEGILAIVNGRSISQLAADSVAEQLEASEQSAEPARILNELINLEVLTQEAEKLDLDKQPDIAVALQLQYTQTMANAYLAEISTSIDVTEEALRAEYERQTSNISLEEYKASHVLLESEEDAQQVIDELADGADFVELAKERSTGPTGPEGGDLGWFQSGSMVDEFTAAVSSMEVGSTSLVPVQTQYGWHVIKLVDKRSGALPDYESVKPGLRNLVLRSELAKRVEELNAAAEIKR